MSEPDKFHRAYMNIVYFKNKDGTDKEEPAVWKVKDGSLSIKDCDDRGFYIDIMTHEGTQLSFLLDTDSVGMFITQSGEKESTHLGSIFTDGTMLVRGNVYERNDGTTLIEPEENDE